MEQALKKCAVGFDTSETVEEFSVEDGELKLIKKKITRRNVPPDIKAVKLLLCGESYDDWSDEKLAQEKEKILQRLKENEQE